MAENHHHIAGASGRAGVGILHGDVMRLLLLLSAFLTALTGVVVGTAASAQPVEASASIMLAKPGASAHVVAALPAAAQGAFAALVIWRAPAPLMARSAQRSFGERRRE